MSRARSNLFPQNMREMLIQTRMLPLKNDDKQPDKLIIVAADPTDRRIPLNARNFGGKKYEVAYCRLKELQGLIDQVLPPENEFLKLLENAPGSFLETESWKKVYQRIQKP